MPLCTSSNTSRMPCRSQSARSPRQETLGRDDVAPFAQHRLDHDGGDVVGRRHRREQLDDALQIAVGGVKDVGQEGAEAAPVLRLAGGERQRAQRPAVKAAAKGDDPRPLRVVPGQLQRRLHRFGPRVGEERLPVVGVGADPLGQRPQLLAESRRSRGSESRCRRCGSAPRPARPSPPPPPGDSARSTPWPRRPRRRGRRCRRRPPPCSPTRAGPSAGSNGSATATGGGGRGQSSPWRAGRAAR